MFFNIIIFFIILIILVLFLTGTKGIKEGFFEFPDATHNAFVKDSQDKFNQLTNTVNLLNPALPVNPQSALNIKLSLAGLSAEPTSSGNYKLVPHSDFKIPNSAPGTFQQAKSCESAPNNCSAFDDPTFAANCGMSFDIKGQGADGKPHIGGLFVSADDRKKQMARAESVLSTGSAPYDPYKVYQPTLGKARPGTFALTKDQCVVIQEKVACATKQTFNSPNCAQCYTSQRFARVGPDTPRLPSTIFFVGNGNLFVAPQNRGTCHNWTAAELAAGASGDASAQASVCNATPGQVFQGDAGLLPQCGGCWCCENVPFSMNNVALNPNTPVSMTLAPNSEGTTFTIKVLTTNGTMPWVAGFIQGQTPRGTFNLDLMTLIGNDLFTNKKPKINGTSQINGFRSLVIVPGQTGNSNQLVVAGMMPFSFLSVYDGDALMCDNGPIVTQAASATFLESDPCYGKANAPGNYKLECLQERWVELGGTQQGTGYPSNQASADAIQKDANGNPLDIDTIVNTLAPKMTSAATGTDTNGNPLNLADWNTVSIWATGVPINTPCDGPNKNTGPLSQECLSYLYLNQGVTSHIGGTYTLPPSAVASMVGQGTENTYCQPGTAIDPATPAGLKFGQSLGGINAVKQTYDQINRLANDNTQTNAVRTTAISQCYGVTLDPVVNNTVRGPTQVFAVGPQYQYTQAQAEGVCAQFGAQVATTTQLNAAQQAGADWCFTGWVSDSSNAMYPITTSIQQGCADSPGVQQYTPPGNKAGVNCYGPKPVIGENPGVILPFSQTFWDQPST